MQKSKTFCIKPWIHMATYTTGEALMCCVAKEAAGNLNRETIEEIWIGECDLLVKNLLLIIYS